MLVQTYFNSLLASGLALASTSVPNVDNSTECVSGIHVILVRASTAPLDGGTLLETAHNMTDVIPSSNVYSVPYPAALVNYTWSEGVGVDLTTRALKDYIDDCPDTPVVLLGYSQGAQVVGDTLIGNDGTGVGELLPESYRSNRKPPAFSLAKPNRADDVQFWQSSNLATRHT